MAKELYTEDAEGIGKSLEKRSFCVVFKLARILLEIRFLSERLLCFDRTASWRAFAAGLAAGPTILLTG